ncbi:MAG: hypothetical protein GY854_20895 [Deltaproteobacteria bacterium]|nr:hypothetical protein [Deltaproteobacteria bacterium]
MQKSFWKTVGLFTLLLLLVVACRHSQGPVISSATEAIAYPQEPIIVNLEKYAGRFRKTQVSIEGETHPFLFDTGAGFTVIGSRVAELIGCTPYGQITGFRMHGERVDIPKCKPSDTKIGEFATESNLGFFDIMALLPEGFPPIEGVLSLHTFKDQAVTLDLANNQLIVESAQSLKTRTENMKEMHIAIDRGIDNRQLDVFVEVKTRQGPLWLLLDTGNLAGFYMAPHALKQLGFKEEQLEELFKDAPPEIEFEIVGLGVVRTPVLRENLIHDGVINAEFVEKLVLTMDFKTNRMWGVLKK